MRIVPSNPELPTTVQEVLTAIAGEIREKGHHKGAGDLHYEGPCCLVWNTTRSRLINAGLEDLWHEAKAHMTVRAGLKPGAYELMEWNDHNTTSVVLEMLEAPTTTEKEHVA